MNAIALRGTLVGVSRFECHTYAAELAILLHLHIDAATYLVANFRVKLSAISILSPRSQQRHWVAIAIAPHIGPPSKKHQRSRAKCLLTPRTSPLTQHMMSGPGSDISMALGQSQSTQSHSQAVTVSASDTTGSSRAASPAASFAAIGGSGGGHNSTSLYLLRRPTVQADLSSSLPPVSCPRLACEHPYH
jgi:hypothetical protein